MSGAYLPLTPKHRDEVNEYLAGMWARGFGVTENMLRDACRRRTVEGDAASKDAPL